MNSAGADGVARDGGTVRSGMFGGNEWLIVVIVALVLFGGSQIPKLARNIGQAQKEFKKGLSEGRTRTRTTRPTPTSRSHSTDVTVGPRADRSGVDQATRVAAACSPRAFSRRRRSRSEVPPQTP